LIFVLVFVSRDFEVGINVSCEESTISPRTGLVLLSFGLLFHFCFCCVWFSFFSTILSDKLIGCEEHLWNDMFCVVWLCGIKSSVSHWWSLLLPLTPDISANPCLCSIKCSPVFHLHPKFSWLLLTSQLTNDVRGQTPVGQRWFCLTQLHNYQPDLVIDGKMSWSSGWEISHSQSQDWNAPFVTEPIENWRCQPTECNHWGDWEDLSPVSTLRWSFHCQYGLVFTSSPEEVLICLFVHSLLRAEVYSRPQRWDLIAIQCACPGRRGEIDKCVLVCVWRVGWRRG